MRRFIVGILALFAVSAATASEFTVGINGINSAVLGLTGNGIPIGQVESWRPGKPMKDNDEWVHDQVQPFEVYAGTAVDTANSAYVTWTEDTPEHLRPGLHATEVAGVMIGKKTPDSSLQGVAPNAILYSGSLNAASPTDGDRKFAVTANRIATLTANVRIINVSTGRSLQIFQRADGNQHVTQFMDWSASTHDVLYVVGGAEDTGPVDVPQDNFNGITVAASERLGGGSTGPFMQAASFNTLDFDAEPGERTTIDLIAPGTNIRVASQDNQLALRQGTSYAAPHVSGVAALLQEYAENQIMDVGSPRWGANARRHEVMKAILLNSADKLDGIHGSIRDVVKSDGVTKWTNTNAFFFADTSLDEELGAGHLNAKSAFDNFEPGEYGPSTPGQPSTYVPPIGWDYGSVGGSTTQEYILNQAVSGWVAITLAWDRRVVKTSDGAYTSTDLFFPYDSTEPEGLDAVLSNLDIFLTPVGGGLPVAGSVTTEDNLEHIFFKVEDPGLYKIEVVHQGTGPTASQNYALAWWAGEGPSSTPTGDFNGDGAVNGKDFLAWQRGESPTPFSSGDLADWQGAYNGGAISATTAVPEPNSLLLFLTAVMFVRSTRCINVN